jgi:hypothetical protein
MWQKVKNFMEEWRYQFFYFTFYAGYMPLLLYLPVYLKHVGLTSVQVGILNGIRPILQSLVTPLLIILGEKLRSNKLLFVASCFIAIAKVLIMFLLIKPQQQVCVIKFVNKSNVVVWRVDKLVRVSLLVGDNLPEEQNILTKRVVERDFNKTINSIPTFSGEFVSDKHPGSISEIRKNITKTGKDFKRTLIRGYQPTDVSGMTANPRKRNEIKDTRVKFTIVYNQSELNRVFTALVFLTLFADPFVAAIYTLVDYSCVASTDIRRGYREVRLWETIGWGAMTPIVGLVVFVLSNEMCGMMVEAFHYMFFFFIAFTIIALSIGIQIDFTQKIPEVISKKVHSAHSNLQYGMFSIISAFAGFGHGFLLTFVNWFIDTLGGTTVIMGVATTTKAIIDIILYFTLGRLIEKLGYVATLSIGLLGHLVVFVIYYGITNAWLVILAEAIYGIVYGSLMSTAASFLVKVAPAGSSARMQGMNMIYLFTILIHILYIVDQSSTGN